LLLADDKRLAGEAAALEVETGMLVGLGTGSTAHFAIAALGRRAREGLRFHAVATSLESERQAISLGLSVIAFDDVACVDLTIDGADEIDSRFFAIKGAGGAMLREKVVAAASTRMIVVADATKRVAAIGQARVPVEILPFARAAVLAQLGQSAVLRRVDGVPFVTDNGNNVADCALSLADPATVAACLAAIPGVLGHGLFLDEVDAAYIATDGVVTRLERFRASA
jgi:ribose 5-phosphate isomerase A